MNTLIRSNIKLLSFQGKEFKKPTSKPNIKKASTFTLNWPSFPKRCEMPLREKKIKSETNRKLKISGLREN